MRQQRTLKEIERLYDIPKSCLSRHMNNPRCGYSTRAAESPAGIADDDSIDEFETWLARNSFDTPAEVAMQCKFIVFRLGRIADRAEFGESPDLRTAVSAISAMSKQIESIFAKTSGLLASASVVGSNGALSVVLSGMTEQQLRDFLLRGSTEKRAELT
jgi:hypothetical protein